MKDTIRTGCSSLLARYPFWPAAALVSGLYTWLCLLACMTALSPVGVLALWVFLFGTSLFGWERRPQTGEAVAALALCGSIWFCLLGQLAATGTFPFGAAFFGVWALLVALGLPSALGLLRLAVRARLPYSSTPAPRLLPLWACYTGVLLLVWLPVYLCWGPVRLDPDSVGLLTQAFEGGLNDAHPIAYTLLLKLVLWPFYRLGQMELGAYLFGALQMTLVAAMLAYSLVWMLRRGAGPLLTALGLALFCSTTLYAFHSLVLWKDPLFNGALLLYSLFLYDAARSKGALLCTPKGAAQLVGLTLAVCFLRGNGWLICVACSLALLGFRAGRKRVITLAVPLLLAIKLLTGPVYAALGLSSPLTAEAWAIPLQQVGYVAAHSPEDFSPQQAEALGRVIPLEAMGQAYTKSTVDTIKRDPAFNLQYFGTSQGKLDLLGVWLELMPTHLGDYAIAWLNETTLYTNPRFAGGSYAYTNESENGAFGICSKDIVQYLTGSDFLRQELAARATFIPPALLAFGLAALGAALALRRQGHLVLAFLPMYLVWLGMLVGSPSAGQLRYMLVFAFSIPSALWMAFAKPIDENRTFIV